MEEGKVLGIYLNDHLAGAIMGIELAQRCLESNRGTALGAVLERLIHEIEEDRTALESIMDAIAVRQNPVKQATAWLAEKLGRLKLNGQVIGYSNLSRLLELEILCLGIEGKLGLWTTLSVIKDAYPTLDVIDLEALSSRARQQRQTLESHRAEAAVRAFAPAKVDERTPPLS